jgi:hypothetical protein
MNISYGNMGTLATPNELRAWRIDGPDSHSSFSSSYCIMVDWGARKTTLLSHMQ